MTARGACLKDVLAGVGCLTLVGLAALGGWRYRAQIVGLYRSVVHRPEATPPAHPLGVDSLSEQRQPVAGSPGGGPERPSPEPGVARDAPSRAPVRRARSPSGSPGAASAEPVVGRPSPAALAAARRKREELARPGGPELVVLNAAEIASLIVEGLGPAGERVLDSVEVVLGQDRLALRAAVKTEALGGALGPLTAILSPWEPIRVSGPARVAGVGAVAFEPDSFVVRAFPFPSQAVPAVVDRITGRADGIVPIPVPPTVGDLRIRPDGVTFYRRRGR